MDRNFEDFMSIEIEEHVSIDKEMKEMSPKRNDLGSMLSSPMSEFSRHSYPFKDGMRKKEMISPMPFNIKPFTLPMYDEDEVLSEGESQRNTPTIKNSTWQNMTDT
jgi:hypothetical protein